MKETFTPSELAGEERIAFKRTIKQFESLASRAEATGDFKSASEFWSKALQKQIELYGEQNIQCADLYCCYGNSLLKEGQKLVDELSAGILEQRMRGVKDEEIKEDLESQQEEVQEVFQLAWEMLEVAKLIYSREEVGQYELKEAEVYSTLAKISLENEDLDTALNDYNSALKKLRSVLPDHHYQIAKTLVEKAKAQIDFKKYSEAEKNIMQAIELLKKHKADVESKKEESVTSKTVTELTLSNINEVAALAQKQLNALKGEKDGMEEVEEVIEDETEKGTSIFSGVKEGETVNYLGSFGSAASSLKSDDTEIKASKKSRTDKESA